VSAPLESQIPDPPGYDAAFGSPFGGETFFHGIRKAGLREYAAYGEGRTPSTMAGKSPSARALLR